ncbi:hypothetical protein HTS61_17965 [Escherichia coli]|nr:hypothetical protein [Escherichia coli]
MSGSGISGVTGGGRRGRKKQLASGYLVNVHTAPDKSVRLRVALLFCEYFSADATGGICSGSLTMPVYFFCTLAPDSFKTLWKELEKNYSEIQIVFSYLFQ